MCAVKFKGDEEDKEGGGGGGGRYSPLRCSAQCSRASPAELAPTGTAPTQSYRCTGLEEHAGGGGGEGTRKVSMKTTDQELQLNWICLGVKYAMQLL